MLTDDSTANMNMVWKHIKSSSKNVSKTTRQRKAEMKLYSYQQVVYQKLMGGLTIFPEANIKAVVFGSLILIMTAAKRCKAIPIKRSTY